MTEIGIRELKAGASGILRKVQETGAIYIVTRRGKAIGAIVPALGAAGRDERNAWDELLVLAGKAAAQWKENASPVEVLSEMRR